MEPEKCDACGTREQLKRRYCLIIAANNRIINPDQAEEKRRKMTTNMSTGRSDLYKWPEDHEFPYFLKSYTEDQAGQYIRPDNELTVRAKNGYWFTDEEAAQFENNNTMGTVTYGTSEHCMESGLVQQACTTCKNPSNCGYVIMYIWEYKGQTWFIDSVRVSLIFRMRTNRAKANKRAAWTNNRSKRLMREDLKVRFSLHYLKQDLTGDEYSAVIKERTRFADEKLFRDL